MTLLLGALKFGALLVSFAWISILVGVLSVGLPIALFLRYICGFKWSEIL